MNLTNKLEEGCCSDTRWSNSDWEEKCTWMDAAERNRENAQQLLLLWDVRYCRLCAVEEAQEDVASVGSVAVNLLCCLLAQAAHHTLHPAYSKVEGRKHTGGLRRGSIPNT
ncbi:hypothetical protein EYF80_018201 [Liparis tanakae]|uniref:Uncharacterized protein n=1 Tax=Liparis tanakae TaxID=230148 RepID=A0A4Z2I220_9TELE|nr:hypothetical protein EYF80_018201 [Liparis tanakae]